MSLLHMKSLTATCVKWQIGETGLGLGEKKKKEKHCLCPKIMVNNYPMFPIVSAADP